MTAFTLICLASACAGTDQAALGTPTVPPGATARSAGPTQGATAGPGERPTAGLVEVHGVVFTDLHIGGEACRQQMPQELSGVVLTFTDEDGAVLDETTTGPIRLQALPDGCRLYAAYAATLPHRDVFAVDFDPPEPVTLPGGGYFDGANQLEHQTITFDDLAEQGFEWHFEAPPAFVVP